MDMVDEKKTILMTKLAIFEKHEKNKSLVVSKYYRRSGNEDAPAWWKDL